MRNVVTSLFVFVTLLLASPAPSQDAFTELQRLGGPASALAVDGQYVYAGQGLDLVVYSHDSSSLTELGRVRMFNAATDIDVQDGFVYVSGAGENNNLLIVDARDPARPLAGPSIGFFAFNADVEGSLLVLKGNGEIYDVSDPLNPQEISTAPHCGYGGEPVIRGSHVYFACSTVGLTIVDISNPSSPQLAGSVSNLRSGAGLALTETRAYLSGDGYVDVVDITDPANPTRLESIPVRHADGGIAALGDDFIAVSLTYGGVAFINAADPDHPIVFASHDTAGNATDVEFIASAQDGEDPSDWIAATVAVADANGIEIVSVTDNGRFGLIGSAPLDFFPDDLQVGPNYAVVGDYQQGGLQFFRIDAQTSPTLTGSHRPTSFGQPLTLGPVAVDGNLTAVYVQDGSNDAIHVITVGPDGTPGAVLSFEIEYPATALALRDGQVYFAFAGEPALYRGDLPQPSSFQSAPLDTPAAEIQFSPDGLIGVNQRFTSQVTTIEASLAIFDENLQRLSRTFTETSFFDHVMAEERVYTLTNFDLIAYDTSNPAALVELGRYQRSNSIDHYDIDLLGTQTFLQEPGRILTVDFADPTAPRLDSALTGGSYDRTQVLGNLLVYTERNPQRIKVATLAQPSTVTRLSRLSHPSTPLRLDFDSELIGMASEENGFELARVTQGVDGPRLEHVGALDLSDYCNLNALGCADDVVINGDLAFITDTVTINTQVPRGVRIMSIADPQPRQLSYLVPEGDDRFDQYKAIASAGNYLYVIGSGSPNPDFFRAFDISDPTSPSRLGQADLPFGAGSAANSVRIAGNRAYVASLGYGLKIIDLTNPANPALVGEYDAGSSVRDVAVVGTTIFAATLRHGVIALDATNPAALTQLGVVGVDGIERLSLSGDILFGVSGPAQTLHRIDVSDLQNMIVTSTYSSLSYPSDVIALDDRRAVLADNNGGLVLVELGAAEEAIREYLLGMTPSTNDLDVNEDGTVDVADLLAAL